MEYYDVLGVRTDSSEEDIKRAFRRLSRTFHPDRRLDEEEKRSASAQWLRISQAHEVLIDERKASRVHIILTLAAALRLCAHSFCIASSPCHQP